MNKNYVRTRELFFTVILQMNDFYILNKDAGDNSACLPLQWLAQNKIKNDGIENPEYS